jgi:hypothetical protein
MMRKRLAAFLALVLVVAAALGIFVSVQKRQGMVFAYGLAVPSPFNNVVPFSDSSLLYINAGGISEYTLTTGSTKTITPSSLAADLQTAEALNISDNKKFAVVHDWQAVAGSAFDNKLRQLGWDTQKDYWWVIGLDSGSFQPLPQNITSASFNGDTLYAISPGSNSNTLTLYPPDSLIPTKTLTTIPGDVFGVPGGFLINNTSGDIYFTTDGVVNRKLFTNYKVVGITSDTKWAFIIDTSSKFRKLEEVDLHTFTATVIANNVVDLPTILPSGLVLFGTTDGGSLNNPAIRMFSTATQHLTRWGVSKSVVGNSGSVKPIRLLNATTALTSQDDSIVIVSQAPLSRTQPKQ